MQAHAKWNVVLIDKLVLRQEDLLVYKNVFLYSTKCNEAVVVRIILAACSWFEETLAECATKTVCNASLRFLK